MVDVEGKKAKGVDKLAGTRKRYGRAGEKEEEGRLKGKCGRAIAQRERGPEWIEKEGKREGRE